jgi:hypothetical protein
MSERIERWRTRLAELDQALHAISRFSTAYGLWLKERRELEARLRMSDTESMILLAASEVAA